MKRFLFVLSLIPLVLFLSIGKPVFSDTLDNELEKVREEMDEVQDEYEDVESNLTDVREKVKSISEKVTTLSSQISVTQSEIDSLSGEISSLSLQIDKLEDLLKRFNAVLEKKSLERNAVVRGLYKFSRKSPLEIAFSSLGLLDTTQKTAYYKSYFNEAVNTIKEINKDVAKYEGRKEETKKAKEELEKQKDRLASIKVTLTAQVQGAESELSTLQSQESALEDQLNNLASALDELSAKQRDILRRKFGASSESLTVGDFEEAKEALPDPGFSPAYAFFTRGYPHRVGMSQYGAKGRADDGQGWEDILDAYYPNTSIGGDCDEDEEISVQGYGSMSLEEYLYGLGEMPSSWPMEALKAQAVAARTYALNYTRYYWSDGEIKKRSNEVSICTTQDCQVYIGHSKGGRWEEAVDDTCGKIIEYDGKPITAWYASTAGGYTRSSADVWGGSRPWAQRVRDGSCGDWESCSYDGPNYGDSPWFHKAWGDGTEEGPWMTEEQAQDVFNAYLLVEADSGYTEDLSPADQGGIDEDEVIEKLDDEGIDPVGEIKKIEVYDNGQGYTTKVVLYSDNYDGKDFDGYEFRSIFNLRAPGTIVIWTSFFDVLREN